ncbi:helix-turn-helix domain-containing protein [Enterococcus sp. AZ103]|uniref:helix-turn-helix domain-containing protein n=1 Tax=Enterococcus sp. AZ103 TaxID=2774628 RepID=UPI003F26F3C4
MVRTLVLTENVENEMILYEQLRRLSHEAFLTNDLFIYWQKNRSLPVWIDIFPVIIISETIPQAEAKEMSVQLSRDKHVVLLKIDGFLSVEEEEEWLNKGIIHCFSARASLSEMREMMFKYSANVTALGNQNSYVTTFDVFYKQLSPKDQLIIGTLIDSQNKPVTRQALSDVVWHKSNNSTLSQLSLRIKKLNRKIQEVFDFADAIMTNWGKGYCLNEEFYKVHYKELNTDLKVI